LRSGALAGEARSAENVVPRRGPARARPRWRRYSSATSPPPSAFS